MKTRSQFAKVGGALALGALLLTQPGPPAVAPALAEDQSPSVATSPSPTPEQVQALLARVVKNQHRDDQAIQEFERIEHAVSRMGGKNSEVDSDRVSRVLPSGTGIMRLEIKQDGKPVSPEYHRLQLQGAIQALEMVIHPDDHYKRDYAKFEKRQQQRAELVDNVPKAFRVTWGGRETLDGRSFAKLLLEPNPDYQPVSRLTSVFEHVRATMWVDESAGQVARIDAEIVTDIGFGGGIIAKIYRGGHVLLKQSEVEPGIWLPTLFAYDISGRKFLFPFDEDERTENGQYRRVWPPSRAIRMLQDELNKQTAESRVR